MKTAPSAHDNRDGIGDVTTDILTHVLWSQKRDWNLGLLFLFAKFDPAGQNSVTPNRFFFQCDRDSEERSPQAKSHAPPTRQTSEAMTEAFCVIACPTRIETNTTTLSDKLTWQE